MRKEPTFNSRWLKSWLKASLIARPTRYRAIRVVYSVRYLYKKYIRTHIYWRVVRKRHYLLNSEVSWIFKCTYAVKAKAGRRQQAAVESVCTRQLGNLWTLSRALSWRSIRRLQLTGYSRRGRAISQTRAKYFADSVLFFFFPSFRSTRKFQFAARRKMFAPRRNSSKIISPTSMRNNERAATKWI